MKSLLYMQVTLSNKIWNALHSNYLEKKKKTASPFFKKAIWIWVFPVIFMDQKNETEVTLYNFQAKEAFIFLASPCEEAQASLLNDLVPVLYTWWEEFQMEASSHAVHCSWGEAHLGVKPPGVFQLQLSSQVKEIVYRILTSTVWDRGRTQPAHSIVRNSTSLLFMSLIWG